MKRLAIIYADNNKQYKAYVNCGRQGSLTPKEDIRLNQKMTEMGTRWIKIQYAEYLLKGEDLEGFYS